MHSGFRGMPDDRRHMHLSTQDRGGRGERGQPREERQERGGWERPGRRGEPEGRHRHERCQKFQGAQTFRGGRALAFLDRLQVMRATLQRQLGQPEFQAIQPMISGELKAIEYVIEEFIHSFELREIPQDAPLDADSEASRDDEDGSRKGE